MTEQVQQMSTNHNREKGGPLNGFSTSSPRGVVQNDSHAISIGNGGGGDHSRRSGMAEIVRSKRFVGHFLSLRKDRIALRHGDYGAFFMLT
ncbi:hypothetical protein AVEN_266263-1 [Araneus ventricosus]|uniref:Uncharacterized protein n=1 Tax=Araneus ventricosus TaxID=182803 RepID=A0A4Y2G3X4_ARAVE|nr:hypothetical protein AVEN_266263-1 [Araneus ventricosus]